MVNSNKKSLPVKTAAGSPTTVVAGSVPTNILGNGSNPSGNAGSGGASASPTPIPGAGSKAKRGLRTEITQVVSGIGSQFPDGSTITVNGVQTSKQQLLNALAALLALFANVDAGATSLKSLRAALKAASPGGRQLLASIKAGIVALFGKGNPALVAFGFSGTKPRQLTSEQQVVRKQKAAATRELRGTKGPRAIQDVKFQGTVEVQTTLSGTEAASGNAPATSSNTAGAVSTPAVSGNTAPAPGNTGSSAS
jgi:hypothetical protein